MNAPKHTCYGPFNNPIVATMKCLQAENIDTVEFSQFTLYDVVVNIDFGDDPIARLIDGIFNATSVQLWPTPFGWKASYEPESNEAP